MVSIDMNTSGHASDIDLSQLAKKFSYDTPLMNSMAADTSIAVEHDINMENANNLAYSVFTHRSSFIYSTRITQYRLQYL